MMVLDYDTVISQTSHDVEKTKRNIKFSFRHIPFVSFFSFLFAPGQEKIKKTFSYQLIITKWLADDMKARYEQMVDTDLNPMIKHINNLINLNVEVQASVEKQINQLVNKNSDLDKLNVEIQETIANLYTCLRLLKKANKKQPIETSELAKCAAGITANTLKTIYAN